MPKRRQAAHVRQNQSFKGRQFTSEAILWARLAKEAGTNQLTWPSGTHKRTEPERANTPSAEIRQICGPAIDSHPTAITENACSVQSGSTPNRLPKPSSSLNENPCRIDRVYGNFERQVFRHHRSWLMRAKRSVG